MDVIEQVRAAFIENEIEREHNVKCCLYSLI